MLVLLSKVGIVTSARLSSSRRFVILVIAIVAAVATPGGDIISPFVLGHDDVRPLRAVDRPRPGRRALSSRA